MEIGAASICETPASCARPGLGPARLRAPRRNKARGRESRGRLAAVRASGGCESEWRALAVGRSHVRQFPRSADDLRRSVLRGSVRLCAGSRRSSRLRSARRPARGLRSRTRDVVGRAARPLELEKGSVTYASADASSFCSTQQARMKKAAGPSPLILKWTPQAIADFDEIVSSLPQFSAKKAPALGAAFLDATEPLRAFPRMGRLAQGYDAEAIAGEEVRDLLVDDYRLGYRFRARTLRILYIAHLRRGFPRLKRRARKSHSTQRGSSRTRSAASLSGAIRLLDSTQFQISERTASI